jgi:hypothetical protein
MCPLHPRSLLVLLAMGGMLLPLPLSAQSDLAGDLNGDRQVTAADLNLLARYLAGQASLVDRQIELADLDGNDIIDATDYRQLQAQLQIDTTPTAAIPTTSAPNSAVQLDSASSGQVVDRQTGAPIAGARVDIPGAGVSVQTDEQGRFQLPESMPSNEILTARIENYAPYSQTTTAAGGPLRVELDRLNADTLVLQSEVVHLGDDAYSDRSAAASEFQLRSQGRELTRSFQLPQLPPQPPVLSIGSLIGLDTPAAFRAGQTQIAEADMSPLEVELNGSQIRTIDVSSDGIVIPLPQEYLRVGLNTVTLRTGNTTHFVSAGSFGIPISIFGGSLSIGVGSQPREPEPVLDLDDIELANVTVRLPSN